MYGYVVPDTDLVRPKDFAMYRAAYCGMCIQIKKSFGNIPRFSTNYDMTFFTLLAIEAAAPEVEFENITCLGSPGKKTIIKSSEFLKKIADINILLFYSKLEDDVLDTGRHKTIKKLFTAAYNTAKSHQKQACEIIEKNYNDLREYENEKGNSIDKAADYFARLLRDLFVYTIEGANDYNEHYLECMKGIAYNLGKFVYIIDAIDDVTDDYKRGGYNPILLSYPDYAGNRKEYFEKHKVELEFAINSCIFKIIDNFKRISCNQVKGILENIIYYGLKKKADELFNSKKKLRAPNVSIPKKRLKSYKKEWQIEKQEMIEKNGDKT